MATVINNPDTSANNSMSAMVILGVLLVLGILAYFMFSNRAGGGTVRDTVENTTNVEAPQQPAPEQGDVINVVPSQAPAEVNIPDQIDVNVNNPSEGE